MEKEYYDLKELHTMYGISIRTWREYVKGKGLKAAKVGRAYFIAKEDIIQFFKDKAIVRIR